MQKNKALGRAQGQLQRKLGFSSLVLYGVIFMAPHSGLLYYAITQPWTGGFSYLGYVLAGILMLMTVLSYQRMVVEFPEAGSAYAYTSKGINGKVGFVVGWNLLLLYGLLTVFVLKVTCIYLNGIFPSVLVWVLIVGISVIVTLCACIGITISATTVIVVGIYVIIFAITYDTTAIKYMLTTGASLLPALWDSDKVSYFGILQAASLGILAHVGFDSITTLVEETKISIKKVATTLMIAVIMQDLFLISTTLLSQGAVDWRLIPAGELDTIYLYMMQLFTNPAVGGALVAGVNIAFCALVVASLTSCSRVLFSMGRDGVINKKFFGFISPRFNVPTNATLLVGGVMLVCTLFFNWQTVAEIVSFGACIGFGASNIAVFNYFWRKKKDKRIFRSLILPLTASAGICFVITTLSATCLIVGCAWSAIGIVYLEVRYKRIPEFKACINRGELEM